MNRYINRLFHVCITVANIEEALEFYCGVLGLESIGALRNEKAPGAVLRHCRSLGVPCALFGGIVRPGFDAYALSGRRELAGEDLGQLGEELALSL